MELIIRYKNKPLLVYKTYLHRVDYKNDETI